MIEGMHELAITQALLDLVLNKVEELGAKRILKINLVIGDLTGIVEECVDFYFETLSKNTKAEGAELSFRRIPARARCRDCGTEFNPEDLYWTCPSCGGWKVEITAGKECYIESKEVE